LPLLPYLAVLAFLAVAWGWPLYRASKFEGYNLRQLVAVLAYGFAVAYVLAPSGALAFFSGLVRDSRFWRVTRRRGEAESDRRNDGRLFAAALNVLILRLLP